MVRCDASGKTSESDFGGDLPLPGRYLAAVDVADDSFEKGDTVYIRFEVISGRQFDKPDAAPADQRGRKIAEYFSVEDNWLWKLSRFAVAAKILKPGESRDVSFKDEAPGRLLVIEIEDNEYEKDGVKKTKRRIPKNGFWSVDNPEVADVPKDEAALKLWRQGQAANQAASQAQQQQNQQPDNGGQQQGWGGLL
jgi:hypothetical protein